MAIVYPLALPAGPPGIKRITLNQTFVVAESVSPFTLQSQVYAHPGTLWTAQIELPTMSRAQASLWIAFLASLHGKSGRFLLGDPAGTAVLGNAGGAPIVSGANQTGSTLATTGLTGTLKAGDYFHVGSGLTQRLFMNLTDQTGSPATLDIFPSLRESPANGAALVLANAQGVFELDSNVAQYTIDEAKTYGITFGAREAY